MMMIIIIIITIIIIILIITIISVEACENYLDCEKLAHVIQHGLQEFIVENIEGKPTEANDLSHIL